MSHYNRPVKPNIKLVIAYHNEECTIHQEGCNHTNRLTTRTPMPTTYDTNGTYEDWYKVAPCAANGKGFICTKGGCSLCQ